MNYNFGLLPNFLGFAALILYILTLLPGIIRTVFPNLRASKINHYLTIHRRNIGILTFVVALVHGTLITLARNLNFFELSTILRYFQGISSIIVLLLLTVTSNNYSVRHLKQNWKKLHYLTFLLLLILPWHIVDKMYGHWSVFTGISLLLLFSVVSLFIRRIYNIFLNHKTTSTTKAALTPKV